MCEISRQSVNTTGQNSKSSHQCHTMYNIWEDLDNGDCPIVMIFFLLQYCGHAETQTIKLGSFSSPTLWPSSIELCFGVDLDLYVHISCVSPRYSLFHVLLWIVFLCSYGKFFLNYQLTNFWIEYMELDCDDTDEWVLHTMCLFFFNVFTRNYIWFPVCEIVWWNSICPSFHTFR